MPKCILHVGMHKTGTTSIQNSLLNFENDKFLYARLGGDANHSVPIYSIFSEHPEKHFLNRTRRNNGTLQDYIDRIRNDLSSSIKAAGDRTLIISGEDIGVMAEDDIKRLADYLSAHCSSTQVIAYIRPPMSFMNSAFQQTVRSGRRTTLNLPKLYRNYRGSFEKFDTHFGRENVLLKPFDRKKLIGGDSVIDFCSTIGLEFPADRIHRANEFFQGVHLAGLPVQQVLRGQRPRASLRKRGTPHQQCPERAWINKVLLRAQPAEERASGKCRRHLLDRRADGLAARRQRHRGLANRRYKRRGTADADHRCA